MASSSYPFVPYPFEKQPPEEMSARADAFYARMNGRRSVRSFSSEAVPKICIERAILTASTAPSGAHRQPWTFVAISHSDIKRQIRVAAEAEEKRNYGSRMPEEWLDALAPIGTTWEKPYLETAPWLVVLFAQNQTVTTDGEVLKNYYVRESVGIAAGFFIAALHEMGLCTLTHTPSPMHFLSKILNRPKHEKPYILFPVGYPTDDCQVPDFGRKSLEEVAVFHEQRAST